MVFFYLVMTSDDKCLRWSVKDIFAFDNIGFTHSVQGVKYLTCADCEFGPIGLVLEGMNMVAPARVLAKWCRFEFSLPSPACGNLSHSVYVNVLTLIKRFNQLFQNECHPSIYEWGFETEIRNIFKCSTDFDWRGTVCISRRLIIRKMHALERRRASAMEIQRIIITSVLKAICFRMEMIRSTCWKINWYTGSFTCE